VSATLKKRQSKMKTLMQILNESNGSKIATVTYLSSISGTKNLVGGNATKRVHTQVMLGWSYENSVNNRLQAQGDARTFIAEQLPYGAWVAGMENKVILHKGELYMRAYKMKGAKYVAEYFVNGIPATAAQVALLKAKEAAAKKPSNTQAAEGLVVNQVKPFNIKFENILELKVSGEIFIK
jgi:hypothetical protein